MHWTQTSAGKRKMSRIQKLAAAARKGKEVKAPRANGARPGGARMAREELAELARHGAQTRLAELERECEKLRVFLGIRP